MAAVLFWAGAVLAMIGGFLVVVIAVVSIRRAMDPTEALLAKTPLRPIPQAPNGRTKIRGAVLPSEQGTMTEPLTGQEVVWCRIEGFRARAASSSQSHGYVPAFAESDGRDFFVRDASGQHVRVVAQGARYMAPMDMFGGVRVLVNPDDAPWTRHDLTPHVDAWLRQRVGGSTTTVKAHRYLVRPGDEVTVVGWLDRSRGAPVMALRPSDPLVVLAVGEETLAKDRAERRRNRIVIGAVGAAMVLAGGLAILLSIGIGVSQAIR